MQEIQINNHAQRPGVTKAPVDPDEIAVWGTVVMVFQGEQHKSLVHFGSFCFRGSSDLMLSKR